MLRNKDTTKISELKKFFSSAEASRQTLFSELCALKIPARMFRAVDKENETYTACQKFMLLMLFPLFTVKHISDYGKSSLYLLFKCGKDVFYRFANNPVFPWRQFAYRFNMYLLKRVKSSSYSDEKERMRCLIVDDTDLPKRGKCFELLSRIYSHVTSSFSYGFKGLFVGYHDGKSFFGLDFSLHGEKGDEKKKNHLPYGLTKQQLKARYRKVRAEHSAGKQRENEYFKKKTEMLISMVRTAILQGIRFDYLLADSWFCNAELVQFIVSRRIKCHFLGMLKKGNTRYLFKDKLLTFNEILNNLRHAEKMKYSRKLNSYHYSAIVDFKGVAVKLFFCRTGKRGVWRGLLSTNASLTFEKAFELYATRWTIEVFFKECKQYLQLGKCESRDFDAQISATTLCMLQYNLFSAVRRFEGYESFGALFRQAKSEILELNVKERIWLVIKEILTSLSRYLEVDCDLLLQNILADNEEVTNLLNLKSLVSTA